MSHKGLSDYKVWMIYAFAITVVFAIRTESDHRREHELEVEKIRAGVATVRS